MVRSSIFDPHEAILQASLAQYGLYPPEEEKARLSQVTGLPRKKIWDWFNKHRQRAKPIDERRPRMAKRARDAREAVAMQDETDNDDSAEAVAAVINSSMRVQPTGRVLLSPTPDEDIEMQLGAPSRGVTVGRPAAAEIASVAGKRKKKVPVAKARPSKKARKAVKAKAETKDVKVKIEDEEEDVKVKVEDEE